MPTTPPDPARIDLRLHLQLPPVLPGSRCIAEWLRRLAAVIERGDSPHSAGASATLSLGVTRAPPADGRPDGAVADDAPGS
jgi:hypothetical protein